MLAISYRWLLAPKFKTALFKLRDIHSIPDARETYNIAKILELIERELPRIEQRKRELYHAYAIELKNQGKGEPNEENQHTKEESDRAFKEAEIAHQKGLEEKIDPFLAEALEIPKQHLIPFTLLDGLNLTPAEILACNQLFDFSGVDDQEGLIKQITSSDVQRESQRL